MAKEFNRRPYQKLMMDWLNDKPRSAVFAEMGLGKTSTVLTQLHADYFAGVRTRPTLVLAPKYVAEYTWTGEQKKWNHLADFDIVPIIGSPKERKAALLIDAPVFTINYENIPWLVDELSGKWPFGTVVADESTKLKSFRSRQGGKRAAALGRIAHTDTKHWVNLTGTPSPNGLVDLWGQMWFVDGGKRLGRTFKAFSDRWFRPTWDGYGLEPLPYAHDQIHAAIADVCLSIRTADWFDLREPIHMKVEIELPKKARALYTEMEKRMFFELENSLGDSLEVEAFGAAARTLKCLQIANGAVYVDDKTNYEEIHDAKIQALESIIEDAAGTPVLVAYNFKSDLIRLRRAFPNAACIGDNSSVLDDWNAGRIPILLAHPASAGHGLNLQDGGNIIVFFGHDWNLEYYQQIIERIGPARQAQAGYNRDVYIYHIIARDTVDEMVCARRESKRAVQDILLDALNKHRRTI